MGTLLGVPELCATGFNPEMFYKVQLEKLAIASIIEPVSVVYDCFDDQLLHNYHAAQTMKLLIMEISLILQSLPELSNIPSIDEHFGVKRLQKLVMSAIGKIGHNRSTMLQAIMDGKKTKIDFYNGYFLRRAAELGIDCPRLEMIISVVKGKQKMKDQEMQSYIPYRRAL